MPAAAGKARHAVAGRAYQPPGRGVGGLAGAFSARVSGHRGGGDPRPLLSGQCGRLDPGAGPGSRHPLGGQLFLLAGAEGATPGAGAETGGRAHPHHAARAGMGALQPQGPSCQEQGASGPLRGATVHRLPKPQRDQRALYPTGSAPGRLGDRGQGAA